MLLDLKSWAISKIVCITCWPALFKGLVIVLNADWLLQMIVLFGIC